MGYVVAARHLACSGGAQDLRARLAEESQRASFLPSLLPGSYFAAAGE